MLQNRVKRILKEGGLALGGHVGSMGGITMVEIIGHAGFDAVFIDMEHTAYDLRDIQVMILAAERIGITPIVRTPGFDPAFILRILDMGAQGIQVPHIGGAADARAAVQAVRYPPVGDRGMIGSSRPEEYGRVPALRHMEESNREITLTVMIEDLKALEEIDAIASTEGIDIVAIGPADMSRALGTTGRPDDPKMAETVHRVADVIRKSGKARMAFPVNHPAFPLSISQLKALGVGYSNCPPAPETLLLRSMTQQVSDLRRQMG
jgi:4-hydroxy-2-oxoheptanedioate aldolase